MNRTTTGAVLLGLLLLGTSQAWARTWKDNTGKFSVEAELVEVKADVVMLKKATNGKVISVPLSRLCDADRRYLDSLDKAETVEKPAARPTGFETPEAAFQAFQKAARKRDYAAAFACMSPDSQEAVATMLSIPLGMMAASDPTKKQQVSDLLAKHNVSLDAQGIPFDKVPDKVAFIVDVINWLNKNANDKQVSGAMNAVANGKLGPVNVDGDTAKSKLSDKSGRSDDIEFVRVDGRWFIQVSAQTEFNSGPPTGAAELDNRVEFASAGGLAGNVTGG